MSLGIRFAQPFYQGAATSVDDRWPFYLAGHGYLIDTASQEWGWQTVPMIRQQSDTADRPGEQSLNPDGLWRRSQESWHDGAGQQWLDKPGSEPYRFDTSKGVDPWTKWGLTLLPDTTQTVANAATNLSLTTAQNRLYMGAGNKISVSGANGTTFTTASMSSTQQVNSVASDGTTVYAGIGSDGIWTNPSTATTFTQFATGTVNLVRYVKGRLVAAAGNSIYNVTGSGAVTAGTLLLTHPNPSWTWSDACEGTGFIYLTGFAADHSAVYRVTIASDGTDLSPAVQAGQLPDGEVARSVTGYLGYVVVGTDTGVRFAVADPSSGDLTFGPRIPTTSPVLCGEGQDRFVWYGLSNYDSASTGLGRMDLTAFTQDLTPAYASDLMATGQGTVSSVVTYLNKRWFTVNGLGLYRQADTLVSSGSLSMGKFGWDLPDPKTAIGAQVAHPPLPAGGSVVLSVGTDDDLPASVGSSSAVGSVSSGADSFALNDLRGTDFQVTVTLVNTGLRRVTLFADPAATRTITYSFPLLLHDEVEVAPDVLEAVDVKAEFDYLVSLFREHRVVNMQEGSYADRVVLDDFVWHPRNRTADRTGWQGTFVARLKGLSA